MTYRLAMMLFAAALPACAIDDDPATGERAEAIATTLPQCDAQSPGYTPGIFVQAIQRHDQRYWHSFPNSEEVGVAVHSFEQTLWEIPRTNGYEYKVAQVVNLDGNWQTVSSDFFLVGISDASAPSPGYLMSPPSTTDVRQPFPGVPFSPTQSDFSSLVALTANSGAAPVSADSYACVTVLDIHDRFLDFFALGSTHDPSGQPW